jgi:hypothetical protein
MEVDKMPLKKGKKNIGKNITELEGANLSKPNNKKRSRSQILAIALNVAIGNKKGGEKNKKSKKNSRS